MGGMGIGRPWRLDRRRRWKGWGLVVWYGRKVSVALLWVPADLWVGWYVAGQGEVYWGLVPTIVVRIRF